MQKNCVSLWDNLCETALPDAASRIPLERRILQQVWRQELTPYQQQLIEAYYFHGETIPQIAAALGRNKSSVSRGLNRSRKRLAERVNRYVQVYNLTGQSPLQCGGE